MISAEELGLRLRAARERKHLTQRKLAQKIYTSNTVICNHEAGKQYPSLPVLYSVAKELGISIDDLLKED